MDGLRSGLGWSIQEELSSGGLEIRGPTIPQDQIYNLMMIVPTSTTPVCGVEVEF